MDWMWLGMSNLDCSLRRLLYMWGSPTGNWPPSHPIYALFKATRLRWQKQRFKLAEHGSHPARRCPARRSVCLCYCVWLWCFNVLIHLHGPDRTGAPGQAAEMNPVNATSLYVSASRSVLQCDPRDPRALAELCKLLPFFRQSLSCLVCGKCVCVCVCVCVHLILT